LAGFKLNASKNLIINEIHVIWGRKMTKKIRVVIADDEKLFLDGLQTILGLEKDIEIVGLAVNGREAFERAQEMQPDVVLLEVRMPEMDGVESLQLIKQVLPNTKVVMLTTFNDEDYIIRALAAGADGYLLKDLDAQQLVDAVRGVFYDQLMLPVKVAGKLVERLTVLQTIDNTRRKTKRLDKHVLDLTPREKEIAVLMVEGLTNREIAAHLGLREGTIKNYISVIYSKIGTSERTRAVYYLVKYL
jgi:DNA-binding NarL/FixJ family response regulator